MSSLVPPQVLVDTPRPQKDGEKRDDISIALSNYVNTRPKSPRSPRPSNKNCSLQVNKTLRGKSPVPPSK